MNKNRRKSKEKIGVVVEEIRLIIRKQKFVVWVD